MPAPDIVCSLVDRFERNREDYRSSEYKEANVRSEFIDPFFEALGWDVNNTQGYGEQYKDVVFEDRVSISGVTKAPDYAFRVGGQRKFFVEAKKPSVDLHRDIRPAFQLRRYAWSAGLPVSILTDFEELVVYDCRSEPERTDSPWKGRLTYFTFDEYVEKWTDIAAVFSKKAVYRGEFDRYVQAKKSPKGEATVDLAFLHDIERWRETLAKDIARRNSKLTRRELNFAVQRTIDRVIFLRICEDRGIEPYGELQELAKGGGVYPKLIELFRDADARYNSGLFHFSEDRGREEAPDILTPSIEIGDEPLQAMVGRLYYPESPYEFSAIPAHILGQVYEQFLGKVIRLTTSRQAVVEEKPEVRKAGGVYYTPKYVVDYIVEQVLTPLVEGKDWKKAREIRVLDPACGSGSFLIGAYQYLLDWHLAHYIETDPEHHARGRPPRLYRDEHGEWCLTTSEKKRILLDNIYGVDIDTQAVEVTKLSLLLKMLEGETASTTQREMFKERVLPDLSTNIKCGNALIEHDYYAEKSYDAFSEEDLYSINAFNWSGQFASIIGGGGRCHHRESAV